MLSHKTANLHVGIVSLVFVPIHFWGYKILRLSIDCKCDTQIFNLFKI